MATAEQIKALLRSHIDRDEKRFYSVAMQVAASEARIGHNKLADDIKKLVEQSQLNPRVTAVAPTPISKVMKGDLTGLLNISHPDVRFSEIALSTDIQAHFQRIVLEQRQKDKLARYGLKPRRKILLTGPPGTGKSMSTAVLATELRLPLYTVVLDGLITRYMGETASKLRLIFDHIQQTRAVYLFDEFDAIGTQRGATNDVGEIRRVLNSFLMFVEQDSSESIIVAATNHPELLDKALHRRFDDIIPFELPSVEQIRQIMENRLSNFDLIGIEWSEVVNKAIGLSCADIVRACDDAAKDAVLHNDSVLSRESLIRSIEYRHAGKK